ncbi:hypothetical protein ACFL1X_11860 [Candidatus Hydrogenedentota bacterium]
MSTLETLEKATRAWPQAERENLGRTFGIDYTALRYQGTGSMEGLEFLYPFLNDSDKHVRHCAMFAVGRIFQGTGAKNLDKLSYITGNRDRSIRDRACTILGQTLAGERPEVFLDILRPSYTHKNNFIRALGIRALGLAGAGKAHAELMPVFAEHIQDKDNLVSRNAITGLGAAFWESGDKMALGLLAPHVPFQTANGVEGESHWTWQRRWRQIEFVSQAAAMVVARIARNSDAEDQAVELLRQRLRPPRMPERMNFEVERTRAGGARAMSWLLRGKPAKALKEMGFILTNLGPDKPRWARRCAQSRAIWAIPGTFEGSGEEGIETANSMLSEKKYAVLKAGILSLGVAARESCSDKVFGGLRPFLTHGNSAIRDVANLAVGLTFHKSGDKDAFEALKDSNLNDKRGPSNSYPFALGLIFQGRGDEGAARELLDLAKLKRRRLPGYAAHAVGLIYQGTSSPQAVELLLPLLESGNFYSACAALKLIDFDEQALISYPWWTWTSWPPVNADGPGAAYKFVYEHHLGPRVQFPDSGSKMFLIGLAIE